MQLLEYKEAKPHGSFGFPLEIYCLDNCHPRYRMACHWHMEMELIRVLRGVFRYTIEGKAGEAFKGDLLFVNSGFLHAGEPEDCLYECIVFDPAMLARPGEPEYKLIKDFTDHAALVDTRLPKNDPELAGPLNRLFDEAGRQASAYQLAAQGLLQLGFAQILRKRYYRHVQGENRSSQKKITQLKSALELVETGYSSPITLAGMAEAAGMNPKYFCTFFQQMTGRTPIEYLNGHRIEVACAQLSLGNCSITDLAYECGFNDLSYFIRVFKRYKGITPKQYIKQLAR